ncbi:MAG: SDR family oxidoreductase, partial [Eubacteriales bacterium]|nr:SDR family oxidoreductase [Eubacteriales bacterium]
MLTGQLAPVSSSFCDRVSQHHRIIASSADINQSYIGEIYKSFNYDVNSEAFSRLFNVYSISTVIYFANRPELGNNAMEQLDQLDKVLSLCAANDVKQFVFVSSTYIYNGLTEVDESTEVNPKDNEGILLWSCEKLCDYYAKNKGISIVTIHAPCMFGMYENQSLVGQLIHQAVTKNSLRIEGDKDQMVDFLSLEDLSEIILRLITEWPEESSIINLAGTRCMTLAQLTDCFADRVQETRISFTGKRIAVCSPVS